MTEGSRPDAGGTGPGVDASADCVIREGWVDLDGDGWGDSERAQPWCGERPDAVAGQPGDCDDADPRVHPGATELCDGLDNDCDGELDELVEERRWFADADGDGYGVADVAMSDCAPPPGFTEADGDCDDDRADVHPDADEVCDATDQDCDGAVDEGVLTLGATVTELGALDDDPRSIALARHGDETIVVWIDELRDIQAQRLNDTGATVGAPMRIAEGVADVPAMPTARVVTGPAGARLFVAYRDGASLWVRTMDLATGALAPPAQLDVGNNPRPIAVLELDSFAVALWTRPGGVWLQELSSAGGLLGEPVEIATADPSATNTVGASATVLDRAGTILVAVLDREPAGAGRHAYVHRVDLRPRLIMDVSPGLFALASGAAPTSVHVVVDPDLEATTPSGLLFVGLGTPPDRRTQIFRFVPSNPGARGTVTLVGQPRPGGVAGAVRAPGGADWWALEEPTPERETIVVRHQPLAKDAGSSVGAVSPLMPRPIAALTERDGRRSMLVYGGRISPTDVSGSAWAVSAGCAL